MKKRGCRSWCGILVFSIAAEAFSTTPRSRRPPSSFALYQDEKPPLSDVLPFESSYSSSSPLFSTPPPNLTADSASVCQIVTRSDGKIPSRLPLQSTHRDMLRKLDSIYHAMAHAETRNLTDNSTDNDPQLASLVRTSLENAGFELLNARDLVLCEALNAGYLLRLSIMPDVSELDPDISRIFYPERFDTEDKNATNGNDDLLFDGRVLVYWRGYSSQRNQGRLLLPKIDYLQASLVQRSAGWVKDRLDVVEGYVATKVSIGCAALRRSIRDACRSAVSSIANDKIRSYVERKIGSNHTLAKDTTLAVLKGRKRGKLFQLKRYGGSSTVRFAPSADPTDALTPFMVGEADSDIWSKDNNLRHNNGFNDTSSEPSLGPALLSLYDMAAGTPKTTPMQRLERTSMGNLIDLYSNSGRKKLLSTFFEQSELVEPTYEEVVVIWKPLPKKQNYYRPRWTVPSFIYELADMFDIEGLPPRAKDKPKPEQLAKAIQIRNFEGVEMSNLPAVLPKTKLVFRPADAVVFDLASILSLGLVLSSVRFDSPRLDLIALVSVVLWTIRTFFRYSNKLARYDLLVKEFLTSKISHRNAGAVKYIATEAGYQRAARAALVHTWISSKVGDLARLDLVEKGRAQINKLVASEKMVDLDVDAALNDLEDVGLIVVEPNGGSVHVVRDSDAISNALRHSWGRVFDGRLQSSIERRRRS